MVIGHSLWQQRFGGAADVVGRTMRLDGESYTIVGVMPPRFVFAPFWATESSSGRRSRSMAGATAADGNSLRSSPGSSPASTRPPPRPTSTR